MSLRSFSSWVRIFLFVPPINSLHIYEMVGFVHLYVAAKKPKNGFPEGSDFSAFWMEKFFN